MSGILGIFSFKEEVNKGAFENALSQQKYRGPDFSMVEQVGVKIILGANCLLLDNRTQSEALGAHAESFLLLDGEVYNHLELASYLKEKYGAELQKANSSEIVACGLTTEGTNFLSKINGPFALCYYNQSTNQIILARDMLGMRSLYLHKDAGQLIVSSDIASIKALTKLTLNQKYLYRMAFLDHFAGFETTETVFNEVSLPTIGSHITLEASGEIVEQNRFENMDFTTNSTSLETAEKEFKPLLEQVFDLETKTNGETGIFLSGGIDSTTIAVLSTEHLLQHQKSIPIFTYTFNEKGDAADYIASQKVLAELQARNGNVYELVGVNLDPEITSADFEKTVKARLAPTLDVREIMYVQMYEEAKKKGVKIILNGMGSDEIFYGYYPLDYWLSIFYREGIFDTENVIAYFRDKQNSLRVSVYTEEFKQAAEEYCRQWVGQKFSEMPDIPEQQKKVTWFLTETINPALLLREEKGGAYNGIEVRFPLVNQILARYVSKLDYKHNLVSTNSGRHLLRKSIEDKLDKSLVYREKNSGPKKRHYWDELWTIYQEHREEILKSELLKGVYVAEFLQDPNMVKNKKDYAIYGNENDVLLEMLGWYFFEKSVL